jgi:S1-C subfamily serine protease
MANAIFGDVRGVMAVQLAKKCAGLALVLSLLCASMLPSRAQESAVQVVSYAKPAVVFVVCATPDGAQSGSGFVISSGANSSKIVTANHVIEGSTEVDIIFDSNPAERYPATIVRRDHVKDVAVLSVNVGHRRSLALENISSISEGTSILVIGFPRATLRFFRRIEGDSLRPSVHSGIVSAIRLGGELIQFDAAIDHGDSGGPIIDATTGKVIAIVRGFPLDPAYAARGIEQALPGTAYGPSSDTIASVAGIGNDVRVPDLAAGAAPPPQPPSTGTNSASYRVGYGIPRESSTGSSGEEINSAVNSSVLDRFVQFLKGDNSLYLIPLQLSADALSDSDHLSGYCEDNRLNAIAAPSFSWRLTGGANLNAFGGVNNYYGMATVTMSVVVFDCYGEPFFVETKSKQENRYFAHRTPDREIVDMANDLVDQLTSDLARVQSERSGAWTSLLKVGIAIDPADGRYHSLDYILKKPEGWKIFVVVPGGPADRAGIRPQDTVVQINGLDASNMTLDQIIQQMNAASYNMTVQRPGGAVTITVNPMHYDEIVRVVQH